LDHLDRSSHPCGQTGQHHQHALAGWSVAVAAAKSLTLARSWAVDSNRWLKAGDDRTAAGMCRVVGQARDRSCLQHRAGRAWIAFVAYRTPVLYSRNQSRTNIVLLGKIGSTCRADLCVSEMEKDSIAKLVSRN